MCDFYNAVMFTPEQEVTALRAENRRLLSLTTEREQEAHDLRMENDELKSKLAGLESRIERITKRIRILWPPNK